MLAVWLVLAECGDYYCGCGEAHVRAVASSEASAQLLKEILTDSKDPHSYGRYYEHQVKGPLALDIILEGK